MLTNISISHLEVGHLQYLNISPSSGWAPPGALRLSYPPRVDFLLPSLTMIPVQVCQCSSARFASEPGLHYFQKKLQRQYLYLLQHLDSSLNIGPCLECSPL